MGKKETIINGNYNFMRPKGVGETNLDFGTELTNGQDTFIYIGKRKKDGKSILLKEDNSITSWFQDGKHSDEPKSVHIAPSLLNTFRRSSLKAMQN